MRLRHWLTNPFATMQNRFRDSLDQIDDLNNGALSLPSPAAWTKRLTVLILIGLTAGTSWSILARVDVVVDARGKLEPLSQSQAVQSKVGGVVTTVLVREGEQVKQGQLLMQLDKTPLLNELQALLLQRNQLVNETAVLRMARQGMSLEELKQKHNIPPELFNRVQTRLLLIAQITGDPSQLNPDQRQRYELFQQQLQDLQASNTLQTSNIDARIAEIESSLSQTEFQYNVEQEMLSQLEPLVEQGAIARSVLLQRAIGVNDLQSQLDQNRLQKRQLQLNQMQSQVQNRQTVTETYQQLQQQLATLDTEFDATIQSNQRELIEVNSQLNQTQLNLKNQDLRAPVDGVVFSLEAKLPGVVAQPGQALLQVVPNESLIARVQVANADIANIRAGMPVDVRIDAYPFTEFGSIEGVVTDVGSEAIAVTQQNIEQTFFPVEIRLNRQFLERDSERLTLVPGMSLVANIKVRERAPISYVAEELIRAVDGMRSVR